MSEKKIIDFIRGLNAEKVTAFLLEIVSLLYAFIADCGASFSLPLLVRFSEPEAYKNMGRHLSVFEPVPSCMLGIPPKSLEKQLHRPQYGTLIFGFEKNRYTDGNLESVVSFCRGEALQEGLPTLVLVLAGNEILECQEENFAGVIYVEDVFQNTHENMEAWSRWLIKTVLSIQEDLRKRIEEISKTEELGIAVFSAAADCVMTSLMHEEIDQDVRDQLMEIMRQGVDDIHENWFSFDDPVLHVKVFRKRLLAYMDTAKEPMAAVDRLHVSGAEFSLIDDALLYDKSFYYIREGVFQKICQQGTDSISSRSFKRQLAKAGVLVTEGRKRDYYSKKIPIMTVYGPRDRDHFIQLRRDLMDMDEEYSLIELILAKGGERHDEHQTRNGIRFSTGCFPQRTEQ